MVPNSPAAVGVKEVETEDEDLTIYPATVSAGNRALVFWEEINWGRRFENLRKCISIWQSEEL